MERASAMPLTQLMLKLPAGGIYNLFLVPTEKAGTSFLLAMHMASLFCSYGEGSALESIVLKAAMVMPILLLQKPHNHSKSRDHVRCL